jgi:hypothetical protein
MASLLDHVCDGFVLFRLAGSLRARSDRVLFDKTPSMAEATSHAAQPLEREQAGASTTHDEMRLRTRGEHKALLRTSPRARSCAVVATTG